MKLLKNVLHCTFGDLIVGETYVSTDGDPRMKIAQSAACKLPPPEMNMVDLQSGIMYKVKKDQQVSKVELGITGMYGKNEFGD